MTTNNHDWKLYKTIDCDWPYKGTITIWKCSKCECKKVKDGMAYNNGRYTAEYYVLPYDDVAEQKQEPECKKYDTTPQEIIDTKFENYMRKIRAEREYYE